MRYKVFGRHTGLRVSKFVLGAGSFGTRWGHGAKPDEVRRIVDGYADAGGNFIDTSDTYEFGESEGLLGEFLRGRRDHFVLATCGSRDVLASELESPGAASPRGSRVIT